MQRIQNRNLYKAFKTEIEVISDKHKRSANVRQLFHGTSSTDPQCIYQDSEEGFDMRYSNAGMWGKALYFAERSSYSHNYTFRR